MNKDSKTHKYQQCNYKNLYFYVFVDANRAKYLLQRVWKANTHPI